MAKSSNQKAKILYLMELFMRETDEEHPVSRKVLEEKLAAQGIRAERKSLYNDIETLKNFGMDIAYRKEHPEGYYLAEREFEMPELKLLVDAVQSSRFITQKKSDTLIRKIEKLTSRYEARALQRQVVVADRIKAMNESIYYNVDNIHRAIQENKKISFTYLDWNLQKELVPRKNGDKQVSPWALIWREENYYLAAFDGEDKIMKHYRVDKMGNVKVLDAKREGVRQFADMDLASYVNQTFGMFAGQEESVTLAFPNRLAGVVLDRFGRESSIRPLKDGQFHIRVRVAVSGQFFGWLAGIGQEARIVGPEAVKEKYRAWLLAILNGEPHQGKE